MLKLLFDILTTNSGLKKDAKWSAWVASCLALAFILHIIAAVRSSGFYHVDEHFQILEFVNFKLGRSPAIDLPLEYNHLMRPWLLPALFTGMTRGWMALGIKSPFDWALGYRIFCSVLGYLSTAGLMLSCYRWFPTRIGIRVQWRTLAVLGLTLIWYLPALHARHSSENVSGSVFFIAIGLLALCLPQDDVEKPLRPQIPSLLAFKIGVLFGLAFEFRYQTGFMILGTLFWLLCIRPIDFRSLTLIFGGIALPIALGTLADRWGYGQWTFAPWNYVNYNLIQNHVSDSEVNPWWDYFRRSLTESWPPLGFILLLSFPVAWLRYPRHLLTWSTAPLFLIHVLIGHKELRFLFPLIHAGPVLLIMSIQDFKSGKNHILKALLRFKQGPIFRNFGLGIVAINFVALIFTTLLPAWTPIRFYEHLHEFNPYGFRLYYQDSSLFDFGGAKMNFYKPEQVPLVRVKDYSEILEVVKESHNPVWFFSPRLGNPLPRSSEDYQPNCHVEFSTLPEWPHWFEKLNPFEMLGRITNWTLYECEPGDRHKILQRGRSFQS